MGYSELTILTFWLLVLIAFVWMTFGFTCKDSMFRFFGAGFACFAASRLWHFLHPLSTENTFDWARVGILALFGLGTVLLVIGALNGSRRYYETPFVLGVAVLISAVGSAFSPIDELSAWMPLAFALSIGHLFAGIFLFRRTRNLKSVSCILVADLTAIGLLVRSGISAVSPFVLYDGLIAFRGQLVCMDALVLVYLLLCGTVMFICRSAAGRKSCEEQ